MKWDGGLIGAVKERQSDLVLNLETKNGLNLNQTLMLILLLQDNFIF